jgi:hypothetical protein
MHLHNRNLYLLSINVIKLCYKISGFQTCGYLVLSYFVYISARQSMFTSNQIQIKNLTYTYNCYLHTEILFIFH